ncbi:DUF2214 domain-containing protein [Roseovarius sp. CAU 1744]|uniref:DUF2214 domain-containing protein n=1 Tax=Roseovarius sp. CAU 1744 TaxID=3140368 RepID=UPI00325A6523
MNLLAEIAGQLPLAGSLRRSLPLYAFVNASHVLGLGMLLGSVLPLDLGILRVPGFGWARDVSDPLRRLALAGFALAAVSGLLLFAVRPEDYLDNRAFTWKVALLAAAGINAVTYVLLARWRLRSALAGMSVGLWLSVLLAGRWIGFS